MEIVDTKGDSRYGIQRHRKMQGYSGVAGSCDARSSTCIRSHLEISRMVQGMEIVYSISSRTAKDLLHKKGDQCSITVLTSCQ